ncbi:MAG: CHASE2 domain-containing protein [Coleofasciculus sp. G1-WW12-02]|uniref:CHASE2 domain-containing protein n=1 Tax=Coleofasciculus sp. G1-WW12-02 TaxID=3068483 RepID=UPI0032F8F83C
MRSRLKTWIKQWQGILLITPSVTLIILALNGAGLFQLLEWATLDQYFRLRPQESPDSRILLVTIDETDINQVGQWPIPDGVLADLINTLKAAKPRVMGLNLYRDLPVEPGHQEWVEVMQSTPNLIGVEKRVGDRVASPPTLDALAQVGLADLLVDADGKIRRGLLSIQPENEDVQLSLAARLALLYLEDEGITLEVINANQPYYRLGKAIFMPFQNHDGGYVDADAGGYQILLNFRGVSATFDTVSLRDVLADQIPPEKIRDRIILIGSKAQSTNDLFFTPYDSTIFAPPRRTAAVVIHANLTSQIISGAIDGRPFIKVLPTLVEAVQIFSWSFLGAAGSLFLLKNQRLNPKSVLQLLALGIYILLAIGCSLIGTYLLFLAGWWLPVVPSLLALTGSAVVTADYQSRQLQQKAQQKYRRIFENALEGIFQTTLDGRYRSANPALAKIYGYNSSEELISTITDITTQIYVDPNRRTHFIKLMEQQGEVVGFESQVYRQDGSIIWICEHARSVCDDQGNVLYYQGFIEDITERKQAQVEREEFTRELFRLNQSFSQFVPRQFLQLLNKDSISDVQLGDQSQQKMSVLFADIRNFTTLSEAMTPQETFNFINRYLSYMEPAIIENQGFIDKYIGDAIMALFSGSADDAVNAAIAMLQHLKLYNKERQKAGECPIEIGIGINTGLMMLGTVGGKTHINSTVISDAVNLASRLEHLTKEYGVSLLISHYTFDHLRDPSDYSFRLIGRVKVKGKTKRVSVFDVFDADPSSVRQKKLKTKTMFEQALCLYYQRDVSKAAKLFQQCLEFVPEDKTAKIYLRRCQN